MIVRNRIESENPHPAAKNATRMGHPECHGY
jgi:hypothetical protein